MKHNHIIKEGRKNHFSVQDSEEPVFYKTSFPVLERQICLKDPGEKGWQNC